MHDLLVNVRQRPQVSEHVHADGHSVGHSARTSISVSPMEAAVCGRVFLDEGISGAKAMLAVIESG